MNNIIFYFDLMKFDLLIVGYYDEGGNKTKNVDSAQKLTGKEKNVDSAQKLTLKKTVFRANDVVYY